MSLVERSNPRDRHGRQCGFNGANCPDRAEHAEVMGSPRPAYQQRVLDEREELHQRIERLGAFLLLESGQHAPTAVSEAEFNRLRRQIAPMQAYRDILDERIAAFVGGA